MWPTFIDRHVADWIERLSSLSTLQFVSESFAHPLVWAPILAGLTLYIVRRGGRGAWAVLFAGTVLTIASQLLLGTVLAGFLGREAPDGVSTAGYLSAHVFNAFCLASLIGRAYRELRPLLRVGAWLVAFVQLYSMMHWFLDVVLAASLGSLVGFVVHQSLHKVEGFLAAPVAPISPRAPRRASNTPRTPTGTRWPARDPFSKR